jgi:hypothetical protein
MQVLISLRSDSKPKMDRAMKAVGITLLCLVLSYKGSAQGTISFSNFGTDPFGHAFSAPIYEEDGTTACGPNYDVALFQGDFTSINSASAMVPGSTTSFTGGGLFSGPTLTIAAIAPGQPTIMTVVVWNSSYGNSWNGALNNGMTSDFGYASFLTTLGGGAAPAGNLELLGSFKLIGPIPEPSTWGLGLVGVLPLVWHKRLAGLGRG